MRDRDLPSDEATSWYVARRISLPHDDAVHALGDLLRSGPSTVAPIPGVAVDGVHHTRPGEARGFSGRLRLGPVLGAVRVEVEVEPWSRSESVIGLRPARRVPAQRANRYFARALSALDVVAGHLLARASTAPEQSEMRRAS